MPYRASATGTTLSSYNLFAKAVRMPGARIPVENIRGPVLLFSSKTGGVWPASIYADEITSTLKGRRRQVENAQFDDATVRPTREYRSPPENRSFFQWD